MLKFARVALIVVAAVMPLRQTLAADEKPAEAKQGG